MKGPGTILHRLENVIYMIKIVKIKGLFYQISLTPRKQN